VTVATDLQRTKGLKPIVFARIDGLNALLWPAGDKSWQTSDPTQQIYPGSSGYFGHSVAVDGDTIVVGEPSATNGGTARGKAYVYRRASAGVWNLEQALTPTTPEDNAQFGVAVAITGDTIFVGCPYQDNAGTNRGSVYVFTRSGTTWTEDQEIQGGIDNEWLGFSVATDGTRMVSGAPGALSSGPGGRVYVYTYSASWTEEDSFQGSSTGAGDQFGYSVDIDGTTMIVGADYGDGVSGRSGEAYVFLYSAGSWSEQQLLMAAAVAKGGRYGSSVSVVGDTCAIGARAATFWGGNAGGSVDVWTRSAGTWSIQQTIGASDAASSHEFGTSVGLNADADALWAGAPGIGTGGDSAGGSVYKFTASGGTWTQTEHKSWTPSNQADNFGQSVAILEDEDISSSPILVVGAEGISGTNGGIKIFEEFFGSAEVLECLHPPKEISQTLNLGTMKASTSGLDFVLEDIKDSDGKSYFGKLFAPARWDTGITRPTTDGSGYNQYMYADDLTIELKDATGMWATSGEGYINGEAFSFTGVAANDLTGVTKGLYSCTGGTWGRTYKQAYGPGETSPWVSQYAYGWGGRRIAVYLTCVDPTTGFVHPQGDEELVWIGRIATDKLTIIQRGPTGRWDLSCISLLGELAQRKLFTDAPEAKQSDGTDSDGKINLYGDSASRTFRVDIYDNNGHRAHTEITISQNVYTIDGVVSGPV
jgi:hypothetical protein